jgi:hypothetical protein
MPVGFAPIEWKVLIAEPAIRSYLDSVKLTEIVRVQLEQVGEDRLLLWGSGDNSNIGRRLL